MSSRAAGFTLIKTLAFSEHVETLLASLGFEKVVVKRSKTAFGESLIIREAVALRCCQAIPGCVRLRQIVTDPVASIVVKYEPGETLDNLKIRRLEDRELAEISFKLADTVNQLHKADIIHNDIKPNNIIYDRISKKLTLVDFANADCINGTGGTVFKDIFVGTPVYLSPEAFLGYYSKASDIYAVGATLYYLFEGRPPFNCIDLKELFREKQKPKLVFRNLTDLNIKMLITEYLNPNPESRPSLTELLPLVNLESRKKILAA